MVKRPRNSFSRLDTFANCERRYYLDVLFPQPSSAAQDRGTHVHAILEDAARQVMVGASWEPALVQAAYQTKGSLPRTEAEDYARRALPILGDLRPQAVEQWFTCVSRKGKTLPFAGKIDLLAANTPVFTESGRLVAVHDEPSVCDYKTLGVRGYPKTSAEARRSLQLRTYCLATGRSNAFFVYFPPKSEAVGVAMKFTEAQLDEAFQWLEHTAAVLDRRWAATEVDDSVWGLAHPDWYLCSPKFCPHWSRCLGAAQAGQAA